MRKYNIPKFLATVFVITSIVLLAIFRPFPILYIETLITIFSIMVIALVAFCGAFLVQIKFSSKPDSMKKIPNIDRITRGLEESIVIGMVTISLIMLFLISGNEYLLNGIIYFTIFQFAYFIGGAISSGLFKNN